MQNAEYGAETGRVKGDFKAEMRSRRPVGRKRGVRHGDLKRYVLEHGRAIVIMAVAACVAGLAYNVLHPRGIFAPEAVVVAPAAPECQKAQGTTAPVKAGATAV